MDLRALLFHITPTRRPDLVERHALMCLQEGARRVAKETLRLRGTLTLASLNNASWQSGAFLESYLRPTPAQLAALTFSDGFVDAEAKLYDSLRILGATLKQSTTGKVLRLMPTDLMAIRNEATLLSGNQVSGSIPKWFADAQGSICIWPWFDQSLLWDSLTMDMAVCPATGEWEKIALPAEAETAVVETALGMAFEFAGRGQDQNLARTHRMRGEHAVAALRTLDSVGSSGTPGLRSQFNVRIRAGGGYL